MATTATPHHWLMYELCPFYTLQPVPATLQRQLAMWSDVLLDHAWASTPAQSSSQFFRRYTLRDEIFKNSKLKRSLSADAVRQVLEFTAEKHSSHCCLVSDDAQEMALLVCTIGISAAVDHIFSWVLQESNSATTSTDLAKNGAVLTFAEMIEGDCMKFPSTTMKPNRASLPAELEAKRCGIVSDEVALQSLMCVLSNRTQAFRVVLFNLDGSDNPPYEGVKIGG